MTLNGIIRSKIDIAGWKEAPELVDEVLAHLNNLHKDAIQKVLRLESQIREAGGEPSIKMVVTWPKPPLEPEPEPEEPL